MKELYITLAIIAVVLVVIAILKLRRIRKNSHYDLVSKSGKEVLDGKKTWLSHPRPQIKRDDYMILCEGWTLNGQNIKVPFPPQSLLSGYKDKVGDKLIYSCKFKRYGEVNKRTLLHFGAVDQIADVYVNDVFVGKHEGGYLPFVFDITDVLKDENKLTVYVTDTLSKVYPYGKQTKKRGGMWYTPVSGIWQNVWLEIVPDEYIKDIKITPDMQNVRFDVEMSDQSKAIGNIRIQLHTGEIYEQQFNTGEIFIDMSKIETLTGERYEPIQWSVENPYLYDVEITVGKDVVKTYFALRKIEIININGINRVCLNGKPIYLNGVLDQGYFCDGIYLPAEEQEYERDILRMKELGINMLRKHIKVEPEIFYYYCDKNGMLVMQDMVNNGPYSFIRDTALPTIGLNKRNDKKRSISKETKDFFEQHMKDEIKHLYNHPCIIAYTIFNEGWGQFDSDRMYAIAKDLDSTRLYDATSGWFIQNDSDFDSYHIYFTDKCPQPKERPWFLSEFGGYTYAVPGHVYSKYASYGYGRCKDEEELTERIVKRYEQLILPLVKEGACGSVYTQLSDVEDEVNGFYTYDRMVCKVNKKRMRELANRIQEQL
ncbi:MAG: glycoside hydrolase family 2 [Lachnospiraceae bacterium]|nr:glycoside hydrolase family 2 [Lachnospiraceae bacterium]